jgi:toxin ParE1/3/4
MQTASAFQSVTMSNLKVVVTADARVDIREIRRYTKNVWGKEQSDAYEQRLVAQMHKLGVYPLLGEEVHEAPGNVRRLVAEQHAIFYEIDNGRINVLRILHVKMDLPSHLYRE